MLCLCGLSLLFFKYGILGLCLCLLAFFKYGIYKRAIRCDVWREGARAGRTFQNFGHSLLEVLDS